MSLSETGMMLRRVRPTEGHAGALPWDLRDWAFRVHSALREQLTRRMQQQQLDYDELAARTGYTSAYVSQVLRGKSRMTTEFLLTVATVLHLQPAEALRQATTTAAS